MTRGGGCSNNLTHLRSCSSRAGVCDRGSVIAVSHLGRTVQFIGGVIPIAAATAPVVAASADSLSDLGSVMSAENQPSQPVPHWRQPLLQSDPCRAATGRSFGLKVRDFHFNIHQRER